MSSDEYEEMVDSLQSIMESFAEAIDNNIADKGLVDTILQEAGLIMAERQLKLIIAKQESMRAARKTQPGTKDFDPKGSSLNDLFTENLKDDLGNDLL